MILFDDLKIGEIYMCQARWGAGDHFVASGVKFIILEKSRFSKEKVFIKVLPLGTDRFFWYSPGRGDGFSFEKARLT